jgi:hypothetical protein
MDRHRKPLSNNLIKEEISWEALKFAYRRAKDIAYNVLNAFKQEGRETSEMMRVFNYHLRKKLRLDTRGDQPTEEEFKNALEQLKEIPKLAPYAVILLSSPIPFSSTMYTGLALYLKRISGGYINLLPDSFNDIFKRGNIEEKHSHGNILKYDGFYIDKFLDESKLNEIGEANIDNLPWDLVYDNKEGALYRFYLGPELYEVHISRNTLNGISFYFSCDGNRDDITNAGQPLTIMSTIMGILKDYLKNNPDVKTFSFVPSIAYDGDDRRLNLYMAYIRKNFPGSKISKDYLNRGYVGVNVDIK